MADGTADLADRTAALVEAAGLADGRVEPAAVASARRAADQVRERLTHGTRHTVVALAGPTGSGKSSLFNTLVGADVARVGVTRPTTGRTQAALFGPGEGIDGLLSWLDVRDRHVVADPSSELTGLVLLDLPDFDSTTAAHRVEVDRLVELVDLLIWVVEPQKYADEMFHTDYLRPLREHADVQRVVLAKTDLVSAADQEAVVADLRRRLDEDGLADASVWPISTTTGAGVGQLGPGLVEAVRDRAAVVRRLDADLRVAARPLGAGSGGEPRAVAVADRRRLVVALSDAAGVDVVTDAVAHDHRQAARRATGWPVVRWFRRRRPARLTGRRLVDGADPVVEKGAVAAALRQVAEAVGSPLGPPWDRAVRRETLAHRDEVAGLLAGRVLDTAREAGRAPRWWRAVGWLQDLVFGVAAVGAAWLVLLVVLGSLRLDTEALVPEVGIFPLPTLLLGGGILAGWLIALIARIPARIGARRRAGRARRRMETVVGEVADDSAVVAIETILADRAELARLTTLAAGTGAA
jgi:GTP-binding protein EngB required for normal cell division